MDRDALRSPARRNFLKSSAMLAAGGTAALSTVVRGGAGETSPGTKRPELSETDIRIQSVETFVLAYETTNPIRDAIHTFADRGGVVTRVHTNVGITGHSYTYFGTIAAGPRVVAQVIQQELAPAIKGEDPFFAKRIRDRMWRATEYHGVSGVVQFGIAAIDMAVWDIVGRALGRPVHQVLGAFRDRVPAYAMVGWYFGNRVEFGRRCRAAVDEGFRAIKLKVGLGTLRDDIERIRTAREAVGSEIRIMIDANQAFTTSTALERGRAYQELGVFWFEEPLPPQNHDGYAELNAKLSLRIATGENEYTKYAFADLIRRNAVDIVQPDGRRAGGVTEWMEIAALADAFHIEVASHGGGPANLNMLAAMPNAIYLESGSLKNQSMYETRLSMVDGEVIAPTVPGLGTAIRDDYIGRHRVR